MFPVGVELFGGWRVGGRRARCIGRGRVHSCTARNQVIGLWDLGEHVAQRQEEMPDANEAEPEEAAEDEAASAEEPALEARRFLQLFIVREPIRESSRLDFRVCVSCQYDRSRHEGRSSCSQYLGGLASGMVAILR